MAQFEYSSIFGELTRNTQLRFDAASKLHKQLFDNAIYEQFIDWDTPSIGLNFEELIGRYNITIAAPTIGDNSKETVLGSESLQTYATRVFKHAITPPMTIQEYRKVLAILDSKSISDSAKKQELVKLMWGDVTDVVNGVKAKLDMIFLGALSNCGKFTFDDTTNPEGGVQGSIDYNMPSTNIASANTKWTEGNSDTVDPFGDIQEVLDAADDKVHITKILAAPSKIAYMLKSTKLKQVVFGKDKNDSPLTLAALNTFLTANEMPTIQKIRRTVRIKNGNTITSLTPFNAKNLVFIPDGKLGTIKNAYADSELKQENGVTYSNYGRIRVSQWGVGETQNSNGTEFSKAESFSLPVITEINGIYTLKTED